MPNTHQAKNVEGCDMNDVDTIRTFLSLFNRVDPSTFLLLYLHIVCYQGAKPPTLGSIRRTSDSAPSYPPLDVLSRGFWASLQAFSSCPRSPRLRAARPFYWLRGYSPK